MPFKLIPPTQFTNVLSVLREPAAIYIVPSFQRPYAWGEKETADLLRDMEKATIVGGSHYLSPVHLVEIDLSDDETLVEFVDDRENADLRVLQQLAKKGELRTIGDEPVHVYAVIDGQQRLTTLLLLGHIYYHHELKNNRRLQPGLDIQLSVDTTMPRLIQNPAADHEFMQKLIRWTRDPELAPPEPGRQSQRRMRANTQTMLDWAAVHHEPLRFLRSENFKTSLIELERGYGLTSFQTLNDRGRSLTVLEKLKSLLLQFASDAGALSLIRRLHMSFGRLYRVLDDCQHLNLMSEEKGDDEIVQLLSCYLRIDNDSGAIEESAETAYQEFFRDHLLQHSDTVQSVIGIWCEGIAQMSDQLEQLNRYLAGALGRDIRSLHFGNPGSVSDDYRAVLLSLGLQPHILALLLKFRAIFNVEWHEQFAVNALPPDLAPIDGLLEDVRRQAQTVGAPSGLTDYVSLLSRASSEIRQKKSMLEVGERLQLLDWNLGSRKRQTFMYRCQDTFAYADAGDFVGSWLTFRSADDFIHNVLFEYNNTTNLRYLLGEYERSHGKNLHFNVPPSVSTDRIALEHIFAQGIDSEPSFMQVGGFGAFGIADRSEYDNKVLWRSGNFTWLSQTANISLGNELPNVKAAHYRQCHGHPSGSARNVCSEIAITKKVGEELASLGSAYRCFRLYVEARCAELALFAVRRFS